MSEEMDRLLALNPCADGLEWVKTQPDLAAAWRACSRSDWMLWLAHHANVGDRVLRLIAADFAEAVLHLTRERDRAVCRRAIEAAREFAEGRIDRTEMAAARAAAWDAARAAAWDAQADIIRRYIPELPLAILETDQ